MYKFILRFFIFALPLSTWATPVSQDVVEETYYQNFRLHLQGMNSDKFIAPFTSFEQKLFVDALWDLIDEGDLNALESLNNVSTFHYELSEKLRIAILRLQYNKLENFPVDLVYELKVMLRSPQVETKIIYLLASYEREITNAGHKDIIDLAKLHPRYFDIVQDTEVKSRIEDNVVSDLFYRTPDTTTYMNGEYLHSVKIFMFCRQNRLFPCLMVMKDMNGEVVRNKDGTIWTHKSLASSARGLPSYTRNGNTPAGIHTIDSVMPVADRQISFGKFRRMILNFIPKSKNEVLMKSLLPESSHSSEWWKSSVTAREIGRNLFRIHGTGRINTDPTVPYYPFMRTSGCIAQRENTYDGIAYQDQRDLLDTIMIAMDHEPSFDNEIKVKGILYLLDIDDENSPVEIEDLTIRGIE